jgi:hypothetical protein
MDEDNSITQLDDFEVLAERARVAQAIAALTDQYRDLNREMSRRGTRGGCCGNAVHEAVGPCGADAGGGDAAG